MGRPARRSSPAGAGSNPFRSAAKILPTGPVGLVTKQQKRSLRAPALRVEPRLGPAKKPQDIATLAEASHNLHETERLLNVRAVHRLAEDVADDIGDIRLPDERPRRLWIEQWHQGAGEVDEAELRQLWARLSVGEVTKPGSVTQKTIHTLRQMSGDDARLLERLGPFVITGSHIIRLDTLGVVFLDPQASTGGPPYG